MSRQWYVVKTKPRAEITAANELERDGVEVYAPLVTRPDQGDGNSLSPLFPGYLFLHLDPESQGWPVFRIGRHLLGLVNFGGHVPALDDDSIADLKRRCEILNQQGGIWRRYKSGEQVRINTSSLQSIGQVVEDGGTPRSRVKVLMNFLDRLVTAHVPRQNVEPIVNPIDELAETRSTSRRRTRGGGRWIKGFGPRAITAG